MAQAWREQLAQSSDSNLAACRSSPTSPPRVAFCVAGVARTFATPLVLESMRRHLVEALAGARAARDGSRLFIQLKLGDAPKLAPATNPEMKYLFAGRLADVPSQLAAAQAALARPWVRALLAEALLLNSTGAHRGNGHGVQLSPTGFARSMPRVASIPPARAAPANVTAQLAVQAADPTRWADYRAPSACTREARLRAASGGRHPPLSSSSSSTLAASGAPGSRRLRDEHDQGAKEVDNSEERGVLALLGMQWCGLAVMRYERAHGLAGGDDGGGGGSTGDEGGRDGGSSSTASSTSRAGALFDVVVYARPDYFFGRPVQPWCSWPVQRVPLTCFASNGDAFWTTPRAHMSFFVRARDAWGRGLSVSHTWWPDPAFVWSWSQMGASGCCAHDCLSELSQSRMLPHTCTTHALYVRVCVHLCPMRVVQVEKPLQLHAACTPRSLHSVPMSGMRSTRD